jgi:peroxiredoxin Q/BCP
VGAQSSLGSLSKGIVAMNFIFILTILVMGLFSKSPAVKEGSVLPTFELYNQNGQLVSSKSLLGQPLVLYFYPKDDTPGCTKEACSFRDGYEAFQDLGARVVGISADDVDSHRAFAAKYRLPFDLLSDPGNQLRKQFGVPADLFGLIPGRVTYVFDKQGICVRVFNAQLQAEKHMTEALNALK